MTIPVLALSAFVIACILHAMSMHVFPLLGLLDFPERYLLHRKRLPYPTGILAIGTFLLLYVGSTTLTLQVYGLIVAILILGTASFIDDRITLHPLLRLSIHILCGLIIFLTGTRIYSISNPLAVFMDYSVLPLDRWVIPSAIFSNPSIIGALFTVGWLTLTINALNWFDGVRGQVSTISLIGFCTIGALSLSSRVGDSQLATIAFVLAGIAAAGLIFDFPPARVVIGDTGSMFFGLMLGVLTIYAGGKVATGFLVLGVPLIDSAIVIARRLLKGHSPFRGNTENEHLHHRLLASGWTERQVIALNALLGTSFGFAALFMDTLQKFASGILLMLLILALSIYAGARR